MPSKQQSKRKARKDRYQADAASSPVGDPAPSATDLNLNAGLHALIPSS